MSVHPDQPLFYLEILPQTGEQGLLSPDESRHVLSSRRMGKGDILYLTDGKGGLAKAVITDVLRKREVMVHIEARTERERPDRILRVAAALPKGDRQVTMLDMLTQLGMTRFTPLICEYSTTRITDKLTARLGRVCLAACKQSRRTWLPDILPAVSPGQFLASITTDARLLLADPDGQMLESNIHTNSKEIIMLTGPEGGFSESELATIRQAGAERVDLGDAILRTETAAVTLLSLAALCS